MRAIRTAVQAVASLVGPTDLAATFPLSDQQMLRDLVGGDDREALRSYSPMHHLSSDDPPALLVYGTADPLFPYTQLKNQGPECIAPRD